MLIDDIVDFKEKSRVGEIIYLVTNGFIYSYRVLGYHPEFHGHVYLVDEKDIRRAIGIYMGIDERFWTDSYNKALDEMWRQKVRDLKKTNDTLFDGMRSIEI